MSDRGAEWYKREPRAFLEGVRRLTEREIAVYAVVLDLIYDGGHQTLNDPKHIASYFSDLGVAAVRRTIERLCEAGKLEVDGEYLTNKRARNQGKTKRELSNIRRDVGHSGGVSSAKSRAKPNGDKGLAEANGQANGSETPSLEGEGEGEGDKKKERTEPSGSGAAPEKASPPAPAEPNGADLGGSYEDRFWALAEMLAAKDVPRSMCGKLANLLGGAFDEGCAILRDVSNAKSARPYLSKIIKQRQDDAKPILASADPTIPSWVSEARSQGYEVKREGKRWRMCGAIYDDTGDQWGG